jgi:hypothetical protein
MLKIGQSYVENFNIYTSPKKVIEKEKNVTMAVLGYPIKT